VKVAYGSDPTRNGTKYSLLKYPTTGGVKNFEIFMTTVKKVISYVALSSRVRPLWKGGVT